MSKNNRTLFGQFARALMVIIAFTLAVLLALIVLLALGTYSMGDELRDGYQPADEMGLVVNVLSMLFGGASFLMVVTPILTILPAFFAVIVAEVVQIRSVLYYTLAGGLSVAVLPILASPAETGFNSHYLAIFATAGFAGGWAYWLMAGRNA
jgi:hypothetical protein